MKETKEEILIVVPVTVYYTDAKARKAALKEIVKLHLDVWSSQGYRAKIKKKGWELHSHCEPIQVQPTLMPKCKYAKE